MSHYDSNALELIWTNLARDAAIETSLTSLSLAPTFETTSVFYDDNLQCLLCGSRAGALALYTTVSRHTPQIGPNLCYRHVHGQDTVTSIQKLGETTKHQKEAYYLTTGRDGTYCIVKVDLEDRIPPKLTVVHQTSTPVGLDIEGAHVCTRPDGNQSIVLHGFRSKTFTVWDETNQTQVMSVDCGGAHRSWAFSLDESSGQGGTFVWTKASKVMYHKQTEPDHQIIQQGGHGREIKALATHQISDDKWLVATGAEDTDIRLFEYRSPRLGDAKLKSITVLKRHTTGLQSIKFSSNGKTLISAGGIEELYAWNLSPVPILGHGVVFACALQSTDPQPDARIMDFDIHVHPEDIDNHNPRYLLVAAFSNGKFKSIQLNPATSTTKPYFTTLHQFDLGTICLTQAHFSPAHPRKAPSNAIVGATNGFINILKLSDSNSDTPKPSPPSDKSPALLHKIHQNSITALQVIRLAPNHQLIVTGGDDNALGITIVSRSSSTSATNSISDSNSTFKSLVIPSAHAAALTALQIIPLNHATSQPDFAENSTIEQFTVLTAGNDQRLQIWKVIIDVERLLSQGATSEIMDEVQVEFCGEEYTNVADISEIAVLSGGTDKYEEGAKDGLEVLIVGVGMEVLRVRT